MKGKNPSRKMRKKGPFSRRKIVGGAHVAHVYVFYHIYCNTNTLDIVRDQVSKILFSGLYDDCTNIFCYLAGKKDQLDIVKKYIETLPKKFTIKEVGVDDTSYERFTMDKIKHIVNDNDKFLYIHTKGVTRTYDKDQTSENVYFWRNYMEYYLIRHYKKCLEKLDTNDIVGTLYKEFMIGPHFSGNFWWAKGSYFKKLAKHHAIGTFYMDPESYIFKEKPKYGQADENNVIADQVSLYSTPMYPKTFMDKPIV